MKKGSSESNTDAPLLNPRLSPSEKTLELAWQLFLGYTTHELSRKLALLRGISALTPGAQGLPIREATELALSWPREKIRN